MNERDTTTLNPSQEKAREALRALPEVQADPEFREALARDFMTGRIMDRPPLDTPRRSPWRTAARWVYVPAAAALLIAAFAVMNRGPDWKVIGTSGEGSVTVGNERIGLRAAARLESHLDAGTTFRVSGNGSVTLLGLETLVVQAAPGTEMTVPTMPGRWVGNTMRTRVNRGEARFVTGPGFAGNRLEIETPEGRVDIRGTVVSVFRDDGVTCVCVLEGKASIGMNDADMEPVPAGKRKVMFGDGRDPMIADIMPEHRNGLIPFVQRNRRYLDPGAGN